jgi:hypothetical protein
MDCGYRGLSLFQLRSVVVVVVVVALQGRRERVPE